MDVGNEHLLHVVQRAQKCRFLAVAGIDADPCEPHLPGARLTHDVQGMLALRGQRAGRKGHAGFVASCRVVDPALRQVKPHIDGGMALTVGQYAEPRDLTVVDLPLAPRPLPRHAN
jgi:hypothetical protein